MDGRQARTGVEWAEMQVRIHRNYDFGAKPERRLGALEE
jgi:hypothetical protein